jgi:hypothetical protein
MRELIRREWHRHVGEIYVDPAIRNDYVGRILQGGIPVKFMDDYTLIAGSGMNIQFNEISKRILFFTSSSSIFTVPAILYPPLPM